jgi:hypothetical protein
MKFSMFAERIARLGLTLAVALACQPTLPSDTDGDTDPTTAGTTTTETTAGVEAPLPCEGEAAPLDAGVVSIPYPDEPSDLRLLFSHVALTCEDPGAGSFVCAGEWSFQLDLPEPLEPGLYSLKDLGNLALSGPSEGCGESIDGRLEGTLEIVEVGADELRARLCHLEGLWVDDDPTVRTNFSFVAPRCSQ